MILVYRILSTLIYPFLIILIFYRRIIKKEDQKRFKEKILISHFNIAKKNRSKLIWFHTASIGEFKSIIPIIKELNINNHDLNFLITSTTLSSGNLAKTELKKFNNVVHRYFPFDVPFLMDKFLYLWKPDRILLVDSEIWPNLIFKAKKYNIPIGIINARLTSRSFNNWMIFPNTAKKIFGLFDLFLCSNSETKNNFEKLNLQNIYFKGNLKLIDNTERKEIFNLNENILKKKRFWIAASTHKEEDIFCIKTHIEIKKKFGDVLTIIAPRHIERADKICYLAKKFNLTTQVLNKNEAISEDKEIVIINYFGALTDFYKYAKSVFIGKSIIKKLRYVGGQNPIEAAKQNCKIYHGPYVYNFDEIYEIFEKNNISKRVNNFEELSKNLAIDLESPFLKNDNISLSIKSLSEKALRDNMSIIENFIK